MLHWVVMRRKVLADGGGAAQPHQAHADKSAVDVAAPAGVDKACTEATAPENAAADKAAADKAAADKAAAVGAMGTAMRYGMAGTIFISFFCLQMNDVLILR